MRPMTERAAFAEASEMSKQRKEQKDARIKQLLAEGLSETVIKERLGVSVHVVRRIREELRRG